MIVDQAWGGCLIDWADVRFMTPRGAIPFPTKHDYGLSCTLLAMISHRSLVCLPGLLKDACPDACRVEVDLENAWDNRNSGLEKPSFLDLKKRLSQAHSLWINMWLVNHDVTIPPAELK